MPAAVADSLFPEGEARRAGKRTRGSYARRRGPDKQARRRRR